jgi:Chromate transporter
VTAAGSHTEPDAPVTPDDARRPASPAGQVGLWPLVGYFFTLGTIGFGGPVALTGYMHRDLVEQRHWISEEEYKEGLALAQLAPGPLAAQLAIYLGYVRHGLLGATLVGLAFPAPSFVMVLAAGWAYVTYQGRTGYRPCSTGSAPPSSPSSPTRPPSSPAAPWAATGSWPPSSWSSLRSPWSPTPRTAC